MWLIMHHYTVVIFSFPLFLLLKTPYWHGLVLQKSLSLVANVLGTEICSLAICDSLKYGIWLVNILFTMSLGVAQFVLYADYMVHVSPHRFLIQTYASGKELSGFCSKENFFMLCSKLFNELVFIIQVT